VVSPCPTGTFTLQDAPSFAWRSNDALNRATGNEADGLWSITLLAEQDKLDAASL